MNGFVLTGAVVHAPSPERLETWEHAGLVCTEGVCRGVFETVPEQYRGLPVFDFGNRLIFPGLTDLHVHAPQFPFRGTGMDLELMEWLDRYAFPEEARYADPAYAERAYGQFAEELRRGATTRAVIFATIHREATLTLMERMEASGLASFVGKVNMDRNAPPELTERHSAGETLAWLETVRERGFRHTCPILTPRFLPSCSDELLARLGELRKQFRLPVQSHLSENPTEIALVRELMPEAAFYGDAYDRFGLFGGEDRCVMAHCVWSTEKEIDRIRRNGVFVAHCPASNTNVASGIAPVRRYLERGLRVGLGSDVAGGHTTSILRAAADAVQVSKLNWRCVDQTAKPLSFSEAFYLATMGGGAFFGAVGCFRNGYAFDAIVLDDGADAFPRPLTAGERMERAAYLGLDRGGVRAKFVDGRVLFRR